MDLLDDLRLFVEIADLGNMSAVARRRAVAPSTITLGLQRLENRVGTPLVTRSTRKLSLTNEGEHFLGDCRRILGQLDEAMDSLRDVGTLSGQLKITATNDFGRTRLAPLVSQFMAEHPGVHISLYLTDGLVNLVEESMDLGIRTGPLSDSSLKARLLIEGNRCICASPEYWQRHGKPEEPRALSEHNCLVLSRPGDPQSNWRFLQQDKALTVKVKGDRTANDGGTLRQWALDGVGVILKSTWDISEDLAAGRLETVLDTYSSELINLYAVYPTGRLSRRARAFIDYLALKLDPNAITKPALL
ncbi:LysR family transcriptional regulator [Gallaecimonas mangrovi]|uniref:LysR family transcriptional regulator n=1 Tax=Gallaecimonas mangrovi TaxID=2291597 RepID=UPI000E205F35|nr:LysR family transcriptional regulator [Gallaecimonas mangrovi]